MATGRQLGELQHTILRLLWERGEASARDDVSLFGLLKEMNSPAARRGLSAMVEFVKGLGAPQGARAGNGNGNTGKP